MSLLRLGRPAALMKTSEPTDCPTLLETRGRGRERERETKRWEGGDETNWLKASLRAELVLDTAPCAFGWQRVPHVCSESGRQVIKT